MADADTRTMAPSPLRGSVRRVSTPYTYGLRGCSRNGCTEPAVATLTYSYSDSTAVLGPLAGAAEPHTYDLCSRHTERLTVPRGWDVVRLPLRQQDLNRTDDLLDIADALRHRAPEAGGTVAPERGRAAAARQPELPFAPPRRHLRAVEDQT